MILFWIIHLPCNISYYVTCCSCKEGKKKCIIRKRGDDEVNKDKYEKTGKHMYHQGSNQPISNQLHNRTANSKACSQHILIKASPARTCH